MIPYSRPKLSDFYTLFESKLAENHTLHSGTYLYSSYMGVPPPPPWGLHPLRLADLPFRNFAMTPISWSSMQSLTLALPCRLAMHATGSAQVLNNTWLLHNLFSHINGTCPFNYELH